jgi:protein TonB
MNRPTGTSFTSRRLIVTVAISLGLHAAALSAVLLLLRAGTPTADTPDKPTEVELVMEEHRGDLAPAAAPAQPAPPSPPAAKPPPEEPRQAEAQAAPAPVEAPVEAQPEPAEPVPATDQKTSDQTAKPEPAPAETPVKEAMREAEPPPPAAQPAPRISLRGTDSPSDARAWGDQVLPAAPNALFHNRPPEYPRDAALNGEHGIVVVLIHVSPAGTAAGVDLVRSSGYESLDRAASLAVQRWRFLPAVKDGQPVASDMTMGFEFVNQ